MPHPVTDSPDCIRLCIQDKDSTQAQERQLTHALHTRIVNDFIAKSDAQKSGFHYA
jgi:hypothetical protein